MALNIAFILNFLEPTGGDRIISHHIDVLRKAGNKVHLYAKGSKEGSDGIFLQKNVRFYDDYSLKHSDFMNYDIIISCGIFGARNALSIKHPNKVFFCQNFDQWVFGTDKLMDEVYSSYDNFMVYSKDLAFAIQKKYGKKNIFFCPNGVEYEDLSEFKETGFKNNKIVCFMSAYNGKLKGFALAGEVFKLLKSKGYKTRSIIASGNPPQYSDEVYISPTFEKKSKLLAQSAVFLNTSLFETWCLAIHEAMAVGTPVVATDSKGIFEYLGKDDALIVQERNAVKIVDAIESIISNETKYLQLQKNGIKNASNYDWRNISSTLVETYEKMNDMRGRRTILPMYMSCSNHFSELNASLKSIYAIAEGYFNEIFVYCDSKDFFTEDQINQLNAFKNITIRRTQSDVSWGGVGNLKNYLPAYLDLAKDTPNDGYILSLDSDTVFVSDYIFRVAEGSRSDLIGHVFKETVFDAQNQGKVIETLEYVQGGCFFLRTGFVKTLNDSLKSNIEEIATKLSLSTGFEKNVLPQDVLLTLAAKKANGTIQSVEFMAKKNISLIHLELTNKKEWKDFGKMMGMERFGKHVRAPKNDSIEREKRSWILEESLLSGLKLKYRKSSPNYIGDEKVIDTFKKTDPWPSRFIFLENNSTVVDIGAHIGVFALMINESVPTGKIICYEPLKESFDILSENIKINSMKNVLVHNKAVSGKKGDIKLNYSDKFPSLSSTASRLINETKLDSSRFVESVSLNDIFEENSLEKIDLLKISCNGEEYNILNSCSNDTLSKINYIVISESKNQKDASEDIEKFLENNSFEIIYGPNHQTQSPEYRNYSKRIYAKNTKFNGKESKLYMKNPLAYHAPGSSKYSRSWLKFCESNLRSIKKIPHAKKHSYTLLTWDNSGKKSLLETSVELLGIDCMVLGKDIPKDDEKNSEVFSGNWVSFMKRKMGLTLEALKKLSSKYIIGLDSRDVILLGSPNEMIDRLIESKPNCKLLYNSEFYIFPNPKEAPEIKSAKEFEGSFPNDKRFLNAGCFVGEREFIIEFLETAMNKEISGRWNKEEQTMTHLAFKEFYPRVDIDRNCEIFETFSNI